MIVPVVPLPGQEVLVRMVKEFKRPGRAGGGGFYEYPKEGRKYLWPELAKIFDDALTTPTAVESAFNILENSMGGDGARILYDIAYSGKYPSQSARAKKALADPEVQKNLTPPIRAAIELRAAPGCPAKKAAIEKYRADLDSRAMPILKPLTSTRGCGGFFKKDDCWPCLHEKGFLDAVIKEIEERGKK